MFYDAAAAYEMRYMEPGEGDMGHKEKAPAMKMDDAHRMYYERAKHWADPARKGHDNGHDL